MKRGPLVIRRRGSGGEADKIEIPETETILQRDGGKKERELWTSTLGTDPAGRGSPSSKIDRPPVV